MLKNPKVWLVCSVLYTSLVLYVSLADADSFLPEKKLFKNQDKVLHLIIYIVLAVVWGISALKNAIKQPLLISFIATLSFGIILESFQETISSYRTYDTVDLIANCLGVIVGTIFVMYYKHKLK